MAAPVEALLTFCFAIPFGFSTAVKNGLTHGQIDIDQAAEVGFVISATVVFNKVIASRCPSHQTDAVVLLGHLKYPVPAIKVPEIWKRIPCSNSKEFLIHNALSARYIR